jgi:hypothetical protein
VAQQDQRFWPTFRNPGRISARTFLGGQTVGPGAPAPIFLRPRDDDDSPLPDPEDEPPSDDPCGGFPFVRLPLIAAQLDLSLGPDPLECPRQTQLDRIEGFVQSVFQRVAPSSFVKATCTHPIVSIGVWPPLGGNPDCELQSRLRALERLDLLERGENVGFFLHGSLLRSLAARGFEEAPKDYSGNGVASRSGPVHLTGLNVELRDPDTVITRITGFDDRPVPDVGFTLILTDRYRADFGFLVADSERRLDKDDADVWKVVLTLFSLGMDAAILYPALLWALQGAVRSALSSGGANQAQGVGAQALRLVPQEIPLPGAPDVPVLNPLIPIPGGGIPIPQPNPTKLVIAYRRAQVTGGGLFFGGLATQKPRTARASVQGPARLEIPRRAPSVTASFTIAAADTFGTLAIAWRPAAGLTVARPSSGTTAITFARGGQGPSDPPLRRTLRVRVADQDGFVTELTHVVELVVEGSDL